IVSHNTEVKINSGITSKLYNLSQHYIPPDTKVSHKNYPLPHPIFGRPRLEWCECFHEGCHKITNDPTILKKHLEEQKAHTYGFHLYHERAIYTLNLTPEKVLQKK